MLSHYPVFLNWYRQSHLATLLVVSHASAMTENAEAQSAISGGGVISSGVEAPAPGAGDAPPANPPPPGMRMKTGSPKQDLVATPAAQTDQHAAVAESRAEAPTPGAPTPGARDAPHASHPAPGKRTEAGRPKQDLTADSPAKTDQHAAAAESKAEAPAPGAGDGLLASPPPSSKCTDARNPRQEPATPPQPQTDQHTAAAASAPEPSDKAPRA